MSSITAMRCDRIEKVLSSDPACAKLLGPKEDTVCTVRGNRKYSREVLYVAEAIHKDGKDAVQITVRDIMGYAMPMLILRSQGKSLPQPDQELFGEFAGNGAAEKPVRPKAKAASASAPRRKSKPVKAEPKPERRAVPDAAPPAEPEPEPEPKPKPKPEPKPEPKSEPELKPKPPPEIQTPPPTPPPTPVAAKPKKAEPVSNNGLTVDEQITLAAGQTPLLFGIAIASNLAAAMHELDHVGRQNSKEFRLIEEALTEVSKHIRIPESCAKEATAASGDDPAP